MEIEKIKQLREKTGASLAFCRQALEKAEGDSVKAEQIILQLNLVHAESKKGERTGAGIVASYIHHDQRLGVLVELRAQTDFVVRSEEFQNLAKEISRHIAANNPSYIKRDDVPREIVVRQEEMFSVDISGKPEEIKRKIVGGRLDKWYGEVCLLEQKYFRDESQTIEQLIKNLAGKVGENIEVARFARFTA